MKTASMKRLRAALLALTVCAAFAQPLRIAAAASLQGSLDEVARAFEGAHPGAKVQISYGASGSLTTQIQQGAPFDLFLAADMAYPAKATENGHGRGPVFAFASGRLVLWVRKDLCVDPAKDGLAVLKDPRLAHIALANPKLAPYGAAAEAALRSANLWDTLQPRLVFGGNIAQTAQYLQVGAAEAGFIAASEARHPELQAKGVEWTVPDSLHPPLTQGGVLLTNGSVPSLADAFAAFLRGAGSQAIFAKYGFGKP
ncbi:MAG TPA: molybdate ABC transporter substrate-binding protein [Holophagaceae bacterium]|jgi:molybdate transport system substrate-binding protein|nr:molybdate ABC transporter substrate-binding protein [Holophagaceae bacterium]